MQDLKIQYYYEDNINMLWDRLRSDSLKHDFYRQLQFIADKRWDGSEVNEVPFGESYPRFAVMNMQQFIFYFYYRTQMLKRNYMIPMHISYIYVFVYEILTGVEELDVEELNSLLNYLIDNIRKHFTLRLFDIRENVRGAIKTTDKDIAKTTLLAKGFREAGQTVANTFRTFADKPEVDYSQKEQKHPITKAVLAPMKAVKNMLVKMELHLDASIDKMDNLAMNVQLDKEKHMENAKV